MKNSTEQQGGRRKSRRRAVLIAICLAFLLVYTAIWNLFFYPGYFESIYFDWNAEAGFTRISVAPPGQQLHSLARIFDALITLQARPWVAAEFRKSGWTEAKGHLYVTVLPFPPLVFRVNPLVEGGEIIDPKVTPLMLAADRDNLRLVKIILASGGDVNARDQRAWTPLMHACMTGLASSEIVQMLIGAGADVNARDSAGRTALIWAARIGAAEKVRLLLAGHADPNAKSEFGESPLSEAVSAGRRDIAAQLLAANADPNARGWEGRTALSIAKVARDAKMVQLLRRAGARE